MEALSSCFGYDLTPTPVGVVPRPEVPFSIEGPLGIVNLVGLFDSGSDVLLLPRSVGEAAGFSPHASVNTYGVSGSAAGELFNAQVSVAGQTFVAPIFVAVDEDVPILLGRAGVWNRFESFTFHNVEQQLCFGAAQPITFGPDWKMLGVSMLLGGFVAWLILR